MGRKNQRYFNLSFPQKNEATQQIETYLEELEGDILKPDLLNFLLAKYLPFFAEKISRQLYQQELLKCLIFLRGILVTLEQELERTRNLPVTRLPFNRSKFPKENSDLTQPDETSEDKEEAEFSASVASKENFSSFTLT